MSTNAEPVTRTIAWFKTAGGAQIFQLPLEFFPGFWGYVYLVLVDDPELGPMQVLVDTGSGMADANEHLVAGLQDVSALTGQTVSLDTLTHILLTHAHIDHFGGLSYVAPRTHARLGVHELDRRILTNYEERLAVVGKRLSDYLMEAGVSAERCQRIIEMYYMTKSLFHSVKVDFTYEALGMRLGPFEMLHVPGHCAGHVIIRLHDVLLCGDHILSHTSPHQSPERLTLSTGLDHYLRSLETMRPWAEQARLGLGGHEETMTNMVERLDSIRSLHVQRLAKVMDLLAEPHTVAEVSQALFREVHGYNVLLAIEEAGAHVEYLYQRGYLGIENLGELENSNGVVPLRYYRLEGETFGVERPPHVP